MGTFLHFGLSMMLMLIGEFNVCIKMLNACPSLCSKTILIGFRVKHFNRKSLLFGQSMFAQQSFIYFFYKIRRTLGDNLCKMNLRRREINEVLNVIL